MSYAVRWIERATSGSRNAASASALPSARTYTSEEIRAWFGLPAEHRRHDAFGADGCCATVRQHVRLAAGQQDTSPASVAEVHRMFGGTS